MIIKGSVVRGLSTPLGSPGRLSHSLGFSCDTLELPWHNNERGRSCIKPDVYLGHVWWSPTLKRLVIRFEDKNDRHDCLIHNGNWAADEVDLDGDGTKEVTQVHGCTEVGRGYGDILRRDGKKQWGIMASSPTLSALINSMMDRSVTTVIVGPLGYATGYHPIELTYSWGEGCTP